MRRSLRFDVLTLFPEMFGPVIGTSILGRANAGGLAEVHVHDIRDHATGPHRKVDDRPFGGGPGMVMMCDPLFDCVQAVERIERERFGSTKRILMTPQGEPLRQQRVEELSQESRLLLIAGHYEGVDERVIEELDPLQISIGDYVLSGGELPAMVLIDAVVRLLPGVLGHEDSAREDSFARVGGGGPRLLDCPHYTRPRVWRGREVPEVLLSGDHEAVAGWRRTRMIERTRQRRPDLLDESGAAKIEAAPRSARQQRAQQPRDKP
jgi:tRNA (guanine37-N1)-methyltransferase